MKIDFSQPLKNLKGEVLKEKDENGKMTDVILSNVTVNALLSMNDEKVEGKEKLKRYKLANKIYGQKEVEVSAEEVTKIEELVSLVFPPLLVGQAYEMLEGKDKEDDGKEPA